MVRFDPRGSNAFAPAAHLAALHLHFLARRFVAHPDQHADALDVWPRTGISLGKAPLSELLYFMWGWCRSHRGGRQDRSCVLRSTTLFSTHHWRFRGGFGILMANAVLFPDRRIWLIPLPVTIPMRPYVAVMGAIEFFSTIGAGGDNVSHICHLGGMLVGYLYLRRGSFLYNVRNSVTDWQYKRNRRRFEVYINKHKKEPPSRPDNWVN